MCVCVCMYVCMCKNSFVLKGLCPLATLLAGVFLGFLVNLLMASVGVRVVYVWVPLACCVCYVHVYVYGWVGGIR